jgi:hypothetical protein
MKLIPRDKIKHLEWNPENGTPTPPVVTPPNTTSTQASRYSLDDILKGKTFYNADKNSAGNYIGVAIALQQALDYATPEGIVATMPELIAAKIKAESTHDLWKKWYGAHTEENIGLDTQGKYVPQGQGILITIHGGGLLTPERIQQAYTAGVIDGSAKYTNEEFSGLLEGKINNEDMPLFLIDDIKKGITDMPRRYGVVLPLATIQSSKSGYHTKEEFLNNDLVIARAGGTQHLDAYFEKAKRTSDNMIGNWHAFNGRDPSVPQGRLLFLDNGYTGLYGNVSLNDDGRFVGVAPEAPSAKK